MILFYHFWDHHSTSTNNINIKLFLLVSDVEFCLFSIWVVGDIDSQSVGITILLDGLLQTTTTLYCTVIMALLMPTKINVDERHSVFLVPYCTRDRGR